VEPFVHFFAIAIPLSLGSVMLYKKMYNPANIFVGWCFMNCYPMDCLRREEIECERGENYEIWVLIHNIPFLGFFLLVVVSCVLTYEKVRSAERRGARWTFSTQQSKIRLRESATQAFLYIAAFFVTYISFGVAGLLGPSPATKEHRGFYFPMVLSAKIFLPLQGFLNCYIYIRPRYNSIRRKQTELPWYTVLYAVISGNDSQTQLAASVRRVRQIRLSRMIMSSQPGIPSQEIQSVPPEPMNDEVSQDFFTPEFVESRHFDTGMLQTEEDEILSSDLQPEIVISQVNEVISAISTYHPQPLSLDPEVPPTNANSEQQGTVSFNFNVVEDCSSDESWTESMEDKVFTA